MVDTEALVNGLSFLGGAEPESAVDPAATSDETEEAEDATLDDLRAELDGRETPQETAPAEESAGEDAPAIALSPEEVAAIVAENDRLKAEQAQLEAAAADDEFTARWDSHWERGLGWYEEQKSRIQHAGLANNVPQVEIDAVIYNRVVRGIGLVDPNTGAPVMGQQQWERETARNEAEETAAYYRGKSAPSLLETLATHYHLDDTDRTALAKFVNYPPEHLEEIARTLGAKNQRTTSTLQHAQTQAATNVRTHLTKLTPPGAPGAPRPKKPYKWGTNPRAETEFVASRLMGWDR